MDPPRAQWEAVVWPWLSQSRRFRGVQHAGHAGAEPGAFDEPRGLAVAGARIWVADMCNHRLQAFQLDGRQASKIS